MEIARLESVYDPLLSVLSPLVYFGFQDLILQTVSACFPSLSSKIDCVLSLKSEGFIINFYNISLGKTIASISSFRHK